MFIFNAVVLLAHVFHFYQIRALCRSCYTINSYCTDSSHTILSAALKIYMSLTPEACMPTLYSVGRPGAVAILEVVIVSCVCLGSD